MERIVCKGFVLIIIRLNSTETCGDGHFIEIYFSEERHFRLGEIVLPVVLFDIDSSPLEFFTGRQI